MLASGDDPRPGDRPFTTHLAKAGTFGVLHLAFRSWNRVVEFGPHKRCDCRSKIRSPQQAWWLALVATLVIGSRQVLSAVKGRVMGNDIRRRGPTAARSGRRR